MGRAKDIVVKVIPAKIATPFVRSHHYSGKIVNNSCLHFGCFLDGRLHGVMSFGPSMDKRRVINLVQTDNKTEAEKWSEFLELNRMAFDDYLPRNSESRCLSIAFRLIKKTRRTLSGLSVFRTRPQAATAPYIGQAVLS